jgi:hypothetical protein
VSKPRYVPDCALGCVDLNGRRRAASEWIHIDGMTRFVCGVCARLLFGLPAESTLERRRRRDVERMQEELPND